jgi:hypothetical protein
MHPRKALLKMLATDSGSFVASGPNAFDGETCIETRNTIYRLRDGVCFAVLHRDRSKRARASALVGMKMVGWVPQGGTPRLTRAWQLGACAVLFRPAAANEEDGSLALTSPTTDFTRGLSSQRLQAFHDSAPPSDSAMYRRGAPPPYVAPPPARLATSSSWTRFHEGAAAPVRPRSPSQTG